MHLNNNNDDVSKASQGKVILKLTLTVSDRRTHSKAFVYITALSTVFFFSYGHALYRHGMVTDSGSL